MRPALERRPGNDRLHVRRGVAGSAALAVYLVCADGHEFAFSYPLTPAEQVQLWEKMDAYCRQQTGQGLEDTRAALLREQREDTPEIQM